MVFFANPSEGTDGVVKTSFNLSHRGEPIAGDGMSRFVIEPGIWLKPERE